MKFIITGKKGECEMFEFKADAGIYLQEQGFGQDANSGYDLRDFSPEELFDAAVKQPLRNPGNYWHAESVEDDAAAQRFCDLQDLVSQD